MIIYKKNLKFYIGILLILLLASCGAPTPNVDKSDHFNGEVFHNLDESELHKSFKDFLKWRFYSKRKDWPDWVDIDQQNIKSNKVKDGEIIITFINHATMLIQIDGVNIVTDPIYSKRSSPFSFIGPKRVKLPGIKFDDLPKIDIILISHNHYDSFDKKTLDDLVKRDNPYILFGIGNANYLKNKTDKSIEMDWGDKIKLNKIEFTFLPAKHWSKRTLFDTNKSLWGSFSIIGSKKIYFAGDTGYSDHFKKIANDFDGFDLSLIPIGAYEPRWFMKYAHMNPQESVLAHIDLRSKKSIAMHFGTFQLTNEAINDPIIDLKKAMQDLKIDKDDFIILKNGQSFKNGDNTNSNL